jgi:hypothetical protein
MSTALRSAISGARSGTRSGAIPTAEGRPAATTVFDLGRIEARRLIRHPSFWLGPIFGLLLLRGAIGAVTRTGFILNIGWLVGGSALSLLISTVLSANIAALRNRRDRTGELFGSLPSPPEARTLGLLTGIVMGPGAIALVVAAASWAAFSRIDDLTDLAEPFVVGQYVLSVLALGTIGVGVARWIPSLLGGPIVIVAHVFTPILWAAPWIVPTSTGVHVVWHLVYLIAVPTMWIALALARDRRTPARFVVAAAAFAFGVTAVALQTPPGGY